MGPRQMGKSSLLARLLANAQENNRRTAMVDFQLFDHQTFASARAFLASFLEWIAERLGTDIQTNGNSKSMSSTMWCTRLFERDLLGDEGAPLLLAMDEVDRVFQTDFSSDFFGMLRSWHNRRAMDPRWRSLDLVLVTSTEPYLFITNLTQSPFNVGQKIDLDEFTEEQVTRLNVLHGSPLTAAEMRELHALVGGHPFLASKALYTIATEQASFAELANPARLDGGPFGDHLRSFMFRICKMPELMRGLREIWRDGTCRDQVVAYRLISAGLVVKRHARLAPRCNLYRLFFAQHLDD